MMYLGKDPVGIASYHDFNPFKYVKSCEGLFDGKELPETVIIDFENNAPTSLWTTFANVTGIKTLVLKNMNFPSDGINLYKSFNSSSIETLVFEKPIKFNRSQRAFSSDSIKKIIGQLDFSLNINNADCFYFSRHLEDIEIVPSTIKQNFTLTGCYDFTINSLIQIANGLDENSTGLSLTFSSTGGSYGTRLTTTLGINNNGLFIADENGIMSIADFITNIKGWILSA